VEYKGIRHTVLIGTERRQWAVVIRPAGVETSRPLAIAGYWEEAMKNQYLVALAIAKASNLNEANEEIFTHEVSDEALEAAAVVKERVGNFTVSYCTVFSNCPA
jgi:hypothetical protein